jgi:transcriptional regulator with XRE-family HTH domain
MSSTETIRQLAAARRRRRLSQTQVAHFLGTTQSAIARLESAGSDPRIGTIARYAEVVGMELSVTPLSKQPSLARTGAEIGAELAHGDNATALRHVIQFLDDVESLPPELRQEAVRDEPERLPDRRWDALLGGIAEYASLRFGFDTPGWAAAPSRFLRRFWFVIEDVLRRPAPGLAAVAFARTPAPLASRGVFLDADSLASV